MALIRIRVRDALRQPLADSVDVQIRGQRSGTVLVNRTNLSGRSLFSGEGLEHVRGAALFGALPDLLKAGLLNLFAKMANTALSTGRTAWSYVQSVYRVRPDRIFANVDRDFRDAVRGGWRRA